jgi:predicted Zn-dependent peptidase
MEKTYISNNGVRVYTYKNETLHGFHLSLFFKAGLIYEDLSELGITHFFEHVAIRNVNRLMNGSLYRELDRLAVEFNASTYSEMCQFYTGGAADSLPFCASLITKLFCPIILDKSEIDAERKRIKAEIRESDDKGSLSFISNEAVHKNTALAFSILGNLQSVGKITKNRLETYRRKITCRENVFFYLTGNFQDADVKTLITEIEKYEIASGEICDNTAPVSHYFFNRDKSDTQIVIKNSQNTSVRFSFDIDMTKISMPEGDLIYDTLFNGYSSPFFIKMSEEEGLFYDITTSSERYKNIGTLSLSFEIKEKELLFALEMALSIFASFKNTPIKNEDMMKAQYVKNAGLLLDDARELAFTFAYDNHMMDNSYRDVASRSKAYDEITPERFLKCAREIIKKENLTLAVKCNKKKISKEKIKELIDKYL